MPHAAAQPPQIHVMEGTMACPNCGRVYAIKKGILNMVLGEDEV